uniref:Histidine biosynthesis bifunctional protein HisIE n=1 Tax=Rhodosorus marinus TaxID=101924 RepID=A0A7S2ZKD9_9RHOD|mmetsp:Transcript_21919/g.89131  ORF Transcript_21919/g.89131 Transcript_21919/m.89131 type:complete len:163 (+) Transcript_21919:120-608(+)
MAFCNITGKSLNSGVKARRSAVVSAVEPKWNLAKLDVDAILKEVKFNADGLVPAIAQQFDSGEVLMMAWMSAESIVETLKSNRAVYYSRSRKELWRKGDTSGQHQHVHDFQVDCDGDTILLTVDQLGVACHTGRRSCFYFAVRDNGLEEILPVVIDPKKLYS